MAVQFSLVKGLVGGDPITQPAFLGRKLVFSQKHKRSRMHKSLPDRGKQEFIFYPKIEEENERSCLPQAHF